MTIRLLRVNPAQLLSGQSYNHLDSPHPSPPASDHFFLPPRLITADSAAVPFLCAQSLNPYRTAIALFSSYIGFVNCNRNLC